MKKGDNCEMIKIFTDLKGIAKLFLVITQNELVFFFLNIYLKLKLNLGNCGFLSKFPERVDIYIKRIKQFFYLQFKLSHINI